MSWLWDRALLIGCLVLFWITGGEETDDDGWDTEMFE